MARSDSEPSWDHRRSTDECSTGCELIRARAPNTILVTVLLHHDPDASHEKYVSEVVIQIRVLDDAKIPSLYRVNLLILSFHARHDHEKPLAGCHHGRALATHQLFPRTNPVTHVELGKLGVASFRSL